LAPWFDEQAHNLTNTSAASAADVSSANSTQIIDTTFELDSNKVYTQVCLLIFLLRSSLISYFFFSLSI
jgi:hypothetical protein